MQGTGSPLRSYRMLDVKHIERIVEESLAGTDMFVVEVKVSPGNEVEVTIDADTRVGIDACATLSRAIEAGLDRDAEDFALTVASAGIGQPLRLLRQYLKLVGRPVDVVFKDGSKRVGKLDAATDTQITVEGEVLELQEIKTTKEHIDF